MTIPNNLPIQLSSFVGRAQQLQSIAALLARERLLTLTGAGGSGKTRLALETARHLLQPADDSAPPFPDGIWYVDLAPLADPALVAQRVASLFALRERADQSPLTTLVQWLRDKYLLLILDNCEHLIDACAQLGESLLLGFAHVRILATSREALHIDGETIFRVPTLVLPAADDILTPSALAQAEAVQLFNARASSARASFALNQENAAHVAQICRRLDGIPLAIELASACLRVLTTAQIAARLDDRFHLLTQGERTALPRHQTLRAAIDWSYDLLSLPERALLRSLAVFAGGWTLEAAEHVALNANALGGDVHDLLGALTDKSLLVVDTQRAGRFGFLETIRQYALERLNESGEAELVRRRHLFYFLRLAEQAAPHLHGAGQSMWWARLESEIDNLRAALWSAHELDESVLSLRLIVALADFWYQRGYWIEGRRWLETALARTPSDDHSLLRGQALAAAGYFASILADYPAFQRYYGEALEILSAHESALDIANARLGQGEAEIVMRGDHQLARTYLEDALAISREAGYHWGSAKALAFLGDVHVSAGNYAQGRACFQESVDLYRMLGDRWALIYPLSGLGGNASHLGDYALSRTILNECIAICREMGNKIMLARSLITLGVNDILQGEFAHTRVYLDEGLTLYRELGFTVGVGDTLERLGSNAMWQGNFDEAQGHLQQALSLFETMGSQTRMSSTHLWFGVLKLYQSDLQAAREYLDKALARFAPSYALGVTMRVQMYLGFLELHAGNDARAEQLLHESLALWRASGNQSGIATTLLYLGWLAIRQRQTAQAITALKESLSLSQAMSSKRLIAECLEALACVAIRRTQFQRGARLLGAAEHLRELMGAPLLPLMRAQHEDDLSVLRVNLDAAATLREWNRGRALSLDEMCAEASAVSGDAPATTVLHPAGLTAREVEVLRLLARGLSNEGIASELKLSRRTVETHVRSIFEKLDVTSRAAATREAVRLKLV